MILEWIGEDGVIRKTFEHIMGQLEISLEKRD